MMEANRNPADYGENFGRAIACEVLARRVVHICPQDRRDALMSTRFRDRESDGDDTEFSTALELAIDSYWYFFSLLQRTACLTRTKYYLSIL